MSIHIHTPPPARRRAPVGQNRPLAEAEAQQTRQRRRPQASLRLGQMAVPLRLKRVWLYPILAVGLGLLLAGANQYLENMPLQDIQVKIQAGTDNAFLTISDLREILGGEEQRKFIGERMSDLNLVELEQRLRANPFIQQVEVHKSMMGVLHVQATLREAVGRLVNNSGTHLYLDPEGHKFPVSPRHTAYVPLIRGDFEESVVDTFACSSIKEALPLLNFLRQNDFWQAQVAEVLIFQDGQIELYPTVSDLPIEFGYPVDIPQKFSNLMDFYRQVPPETGWKKYRRISVKYRGQVVAKK